MTASQCELDWHIDMPSTSGELDRHIRMLSSFCESSCDSDVDIDMLSTSAELDRHIRMLSSSCDSVDFDMQITIEAGPECTLFNTAGMHAL